MIVPSKCNVLYIWIGSDAVDKDTIYALPKNLKPDISISFLREFFGFNSCFCHFPIFFFYFLFISDFNLFFHYAFLTSFFFCFVICYSFFFFLYVAFFHLFFSCSIVASSFVCIFYSVFNLFFNSSLFNSFLVD